MPFWARLIFLASRPTLGMNRSRIVRKSDSLGLTLPKRYTTLSEVTTRNMASSHMHNVANRKPITSP